MSDETRDFYNDLREFRKEERDSRLPAAANEIEALAELGYRVRKINYYHYRVDDRLDFFPLSGRWHFHPGNKRGDYTKPEDICRAHLRPRGRELS